MKKKKAFWDTKNPKKTSKKLTPNEIAGLSDKAQFLDFNGVCNLLASTTGLPAAQALRAIST